MYWKGMRITIQRYVKSCRSFQVNKRHSLKYGHVPPKLVITTTWRALCVDLVGPYTLKGKDGSSIDFMCLTMINPTTSLFKIVELPQLSPNGRFPKRVKVKRQHEPTTLRQQRLLIRLLHKSVTWCTNAGLVDILVLDIRYMAMEVNSNCGSKPYVLHMA